MDRKFYIAWVMVLFLCLTGCGATDYELNDRNAEGVLLGGGIGAGGAALLGASPSVIALSGMGGAALGYYVTTLRYKSDGLIQHGGIVFTQGDFAMIDIPSDLLFDVNTAEMREDAEAILNSAVAVLKRYPYDNIFISGNTSGFYKAKWEQALSEKRAYQVANYLWCEGINDYPLYSKKDKAHRYPFIRKLIYTGFGAAFPIANQIHNDSLRENSRIQITAYPNGLPAHYNKPYKTYHNRGKFEGCVIKIYSSYKG